jgi:hypothetical protein
MLEDPVLFDSLEKEVKIFLGLLKVEVKPVKEESEIKHKKK